MRKLSYWKGTTVVFVLVLATSACGKTVGDTLDDTTTTTRVKTALLNDPAVAGWRIDVETVKGVVTLSGGVRSQEERDQVIAIARAISGVIDVKDALQVIPENNL